MRTIWLSFLLIGPLVLAQQPAVLAPAQGALPSQSATPVPLTQAQIEKMQRKLEDWPQLGRYRDDNLKLAVAAPGERRVVFLGDSITDFWGRHYGRFFPGKPYINRGISGQTTPQMLVRFQQDVIQLHPDVVVILAGINDIAGNTGAEPLDAVENNFRSMVTLARAAHIRVVLSSVLPASSFPWKPGIHPAEPVRELNKWLQSYAASEHLIYLNYYPSLADENGGMREGLAVDKVVHPNDAGYAIMEPLAEKAIEQAFAQTRP